MIGHSRWVAVMLLSAVVLLLLPYGSPSRRLRRVLAPGGRAGAQRRRSTLADPRSVGQRPTERVEEWIKAAATAVGPTMLMVASVGLAALVATVVNGPVTGVVVGTYPTVVYLLVRAARRRRALEASWRLLEEMVVGLAADLRAGLVPSAALGNAATLGLTGLPEAGRKPNSATVSGSVPWTVGRTASRKRSAAGSPTRKPSSPSQVAEVLRAIPAAVDLPELLRTPVAEPAGSVFRRLAAAWEVAETTGAALAGVLDLLAADLRSRRRVRVETAAALAGTTTTAYLLAFLPVAGILVGGWLSADPVTVLTHTPAGALCTVLGLALQCAGLGWNHHLTKAPRMSVPPGMRAS